MTKCGMDDVFKEGSDDFGFGFNDRCGGELSASGCEFIALSRSLKLRTAFLHFAVFRILGGLRFSGFV